MAEEQYDPVEALSSGFAGRIVQAREEAGLEQKELAALIGVTPRALRYWESGKRTPRKPALRALARQLGRPVAWFYETEEVVA